MQFDDKSHAYKFRSFLLKLVVIVAIVTLLIWLLPKFTSYKKNDKNSSNKKEVLNNVSSEFKNNQLKLKDIAFKYYNDDNLPENIGDKSKVTLDELIKLKLASDLSCDGKKCDKSGSYIEITKLDSDYLLKINLKCNNLDDYLIFHVGKYDYCTDTICEVNNDREVKIDTDSSLDDNNSLDQNNNDNDGDSVDDNKSNDKSDDTTDDKSDDSKKDDSSNGLSDFGKWSEYAKTSCDTENITCDINDKNCLEEVKVYKRLEKVGEKKITFRIYPPTITNTGSKTEMLCDKYNYLQINNTMYYTDGNYGEVLLLNKNSTASWNYDGKVSFSKSPTADYRKYYKFAGVDYSECGDKCGSNIKYYYDVYTYKASLNVKNSSLCSSVKSVSYQVYSIKNIIETKTDSRDVYATACYKSVRNRNLIQK